MLNVGKFTTLVDVSEVKSLEDPEGGLDTFKHRLFSVASSAIPTRTAEKALEDRGSRLRALSEKKQFSIIDGEFEETAFREPVLKRR